MLRDLLPVVFVSLWIAASGCSKKDELTNRPPVLQNGTVTPDPVARGAYILITIEANDADGSLDSVTADLTSVGGFSNHPMYDDGSNGDADPNDGTWTLRAKVITTAAPGDVDVVVTATDNEGAASSANLPLTVKSNIVPVLANAAATPASTRAGRTVTFTVEASDDGMVASVTIDLSPMGATATEALYDDGTHGDAIAGDGTWTLDFTLPGSQTDGNYTLTLTATDDAGDASSTQVDLWVVPNVPPAVSNEQVSPSSPAQGDTVTLKADVSDDVSVASVTIDLTGVGGAAGETMYDDGSNGGDATADDGTWTCQHLIPVATATGAKSLTVTATDGDAATGTGAVHFTLAPNPGPTLSAAPSMVTQATGEDTVDFRIQAVDTQGVSSVTVDLSALGGGTSVAMLDDGVAPDTAANDDVYTCRLTLSAHVGPGTHSLPVTAQDVHAATSNGTIPLTVLRLRLEMTNFLYGIAAASSTDVIAAGVQAVGFHGDGTAFRMVNLKNTVSQQKQIGAFGLPTGELYTIGQYAALSDFASGAWNFSRIDASSSNDFRDLWGPDANTLFAVGSSNNLYRYNGASWTQDTTVTGSFHAVWGTTASDVTIVGNNNTIYRWDGTSWNAESVSAAADDFFGVWEDGQGTWYAASATGGAVGYATGDTGEIYQGTGAAGAMTWSQVHNTASTEFYDLHGHRATGTLDIWAVGVSGGIVHSSDGSVWTPQNAGVSESLFSVWAQSASDVWASGAKGVVLHYNGSGWSTVVPPSTYDESWGITASTTADAWKAGTDSAGTQGTIQIYNGSTWTTEHTLATGLRDVFAMAGSTTDVFAVGYNGTVLQRAGGAWAPMTPAFTASPNALYVVWGSAASNLFVGGEDASASGAGVWDFNGSGWSAQHTGFAGGASERVYAIFGFSPSVVYAASNTGNLYAYQGSQAWSDITNQLGAGPFKGFNGMWGSSASDVYLVGNGGQAFHYDGSSWTDMASQLGSPSVDLMDVCGTSASDVCIVGKGMTVFRYDGTAWKALTFQSNAELYGAAASGSLMLLSGENGQVYRLER